MWNQVYDLKSWILNVIIYIAPIVETKVKKDKKEEKKSSDNQYYI